MYRFGGVQELVKAHRRHLQERGHDVRIIAPRTQVDEYSDDPGIIQIGHATKVHGPSTSFEVSISATADEIEQLYDDEQFDVLHVHEPTNPLLARQLVSRAHCPTIGTFHAKLPEGVLNTSFKKAYQPYSKSVLKHLTYLTAVSEAAADFAAESTRMPIEIVPNGVELKHFNPKKVQPFAQYDDATKTILYVGRLEKRKGVEYLLKAYHELRREHDDVRLVIAGDGPKRRSLESYVSSYEVPDVDFLGFVDDARKLELFRVCDVFCSPATYGESFGIVLIEAMAMGVPIVAGNNPGYASVMRGRGRLGLVNSECTLDFAYRLELLLYDEALRGLYLDWAKKEVRQYDYSKIVDRFETLYKQLVKSSLREREAAAS